MSLICILSSASGTCTISPVCVYRYVYLYACICVRVPVYSSSGLGAGRDNEKITLIKPLQTEWSSLFCFSSLLCSSRSLLLFSLPQHLFLRLIPWLILPATQTLLSALVMLLLLLLLLLKHRTLIQLVHVANATQCLVLCSGLSIRACANVHSELQFVERRSHWSFYFVILMPNKGSFDCVRWKSSKHWPLPHYGSKTTLHPQNKLFTTWPKWIIFSLAYPFISPSLQPA